MQVLAILLVPACISDLIRYKIPNILILIGMCIGLYMTDVRNIAQAALIFILMYPFFILRGLGAGDIKLMMMTGCFMDQITFFKCIAIAFAISGVAAVVKMMVIPECRERLFYLGRYVRKAVVTGSIDDYEVDKSRHQVLIRLSLPILCAVLITMI